MQISTLVRVLDDPHLAAEHLDAWKLRDVHRGQAALVELAESGLTLDLLAGLCEQLRQHLPNQAEPDVVLAALKRFLLAARSPLALVALVERDRTALPVLLRGLALGERWRELLVADPEAFDWLRTAEGNVIDRKALVSDAGAEVANLADERAATAALTRFKDRQTLRIAYRSVYGSQESEVTARQLADRNDALIEAALQVAAAIVAQKGPPPPAMAIVALGRQGAGEADFGDALELLVLHEAAEATMAARQSAHEQAEHVTKLVMRILGEGAGSRPVLRLSPVSLPDSTATSASHTVDDALLGYDSFGRTWHRQALLKARPIAGDLTLAQGLLDRLQPWVFRRYLSRADETGIKSLGRRILRRAEKEAGEPNALNVQTKRGGLVDLENAIGFLQLLVGGEQPAVQVRGTLATVGELQQAGVLSTPQRIVLEDNYGWLRRLLYRIQIVDGTDASALPDGPARDAIARGLGLADGAALAGELNERTGQVWEVVSPLIREAVGDESLSPAVDLVLDPAPASVAAASPIAGYGFRDELAAVTALHELAQERIPFLSTRRCRHFLSLIAERLLQAVGATPDPDRTLWDLVRVSNSLGGKGVLWELFSFHPASLQLYVRLCAASPYLSGILTTNPGMIDDLVDSLQLDRLPTRSELDRTLAELSRGTDDVMPILHDLKNSAHLRIGVRDILGKDPIDATHAALADVAEFSLHHVIEREMARLALKHGQPTHGPGPLEGEACRLVVLGLGKLGAREPNYHSNVEIAFLYEAEGATRPAPRSRQQETTNNHFFSQLAQRVLKEATQLTPKGRLATIDVVLRPIGAGGAMAMPLADFANHFASGAAPLWQWQSLCQARPVFGEAAVRAAVANRLEQLLRGRQKLPDERQAIFRARVELERGAAELNLKRAAGGTLDVEFLVQALQLEHVKKSSAVLIPGTQRALAALAAAGVLAADDAQYFAESYRLLRRVESALRLLNTPARHDLPEDDLSLDKLGLLLGQPSGPTVRDRVIITLAENRRRFERLMLA